MPTRLRQTAFNLRIVTVNSRQVQIFFRDVSKFPRVECSLTSSAMDRVPATSSEARYIDVLRSTVVWKMFATVQIKPRQVIRLCCVLG